MKKKINHHVYGIFICCCCCCIKTDRFNFEMKILNKKEQPIKERFITENKNDT